MQPNPYTLEQDTPISYAGFSADCYCFRVELGDAVGLDGVMMEMKLSQWLFDNLGPGAWHMGNGFRKDQPQPKLTNPTGKDTFILFEGLADAVMFEDAFKVTGLTPSMLVP